MSFLISAAHAATPVVGAKSPGFSSIIMLVVFAAFIYFLLWRPQSKRMKQHKNMVSSLKVGDEIITNGGLVGKIAKIEESFIKLIIAANAEVMIQRSAISTILPKGTLKTNE